jgi:tetratricopeptide (TPR) repeat protein
MSTTTIVFGKVFEYDFLSGWIRFKRLEKNLTQEALAYGICSVSHLSYFENGKKKLRPELIESLLSKLELSAITGEQHIGQLRQLFYKLLFQIESFDTENATKTYEELKKLEGFLVQSPYHLEYKLYDLLYQGLVQKKSYSEINPTLKILERTLNAFSNELKSLYHLLYGVSSFKYVSHSIGIEHLKKALDFHESPWVHYRLGFSYCFDNKPLKGIQHLNIALKNYEMNGLYLNALWCHNFLGICYTYLKSYDESKAHFEAALNGALHFGLNEPLSHIYTNLSNLYLQKEDYVKSLEYSGKVMDFPNHLLVSVHNAIEAHIALNQIDECKKLLDIYLSDKYKSSKYYLFLKFDYLRLFSFESDEFYETTTKEILPYFESIDYIEICNEIRLCLIKYLEANRRYKEANNIYKVLFDEFS